MRIEVIILIGFTMALNGADKYVSPSGNDTTGNGSIGNPWLTIQKGSDSTTGAGDVLHIVAGIYDELATFTHDGGLGNPIIVKGDGLVTNKGTFFIEGSNLTFTNLAGTEDGATVYLYAFRITANAKSNIVITTCRVHDTPDVYPGGGIGFENTVVSGIITNLTSNVVITNCSFTNVAGIMIGINGQYAQVVNCWMSNTMGSDCLSVFGRHQLIRGCIGMQIGSTYGNVEHPDFIQTFGASSGFYQWAEDVLVEGNYCIDNPGGAIAQLECNNGTQAVRVANWTFRNNVFADFDVGASVDIPGCHWLNDTFYNCTPVGSVISFGWTDPTSGDPRGLPYGGSISNCAFILCGTNSPQIGWYGAGVNGDYVPSPPVDLYTNVDYNYVCHTGFAQKTVGSGYPVTDPFKFLEPHGVNGGDPKLVNAGAKNFRLLVSSPLADAGSPQAFATDFDGNARPSGSAWDIGAFEGTNAPPPALASIPPQLQNSTIRNGSLR